jgi:hypothetical protein
VALTGADGTVAEAYLYDALGNYRRADVAGAPLGPLGYDPSADGPFGPWNGLSCLAQTQSASPAPATSSTPKSGYTTPKPDFTILKTNSPWGSRVRAAASPMAT